jgi:hypothetical protein
MPRFVILEHDHPFLHWDLMLQVGEVLRTWRLLQPPAVGATVPAEAVFDHRLLYLDYEGPISGDRGQVKRWDSGTYSGEVAAGPCIKIELHGERLQGQALLQREEQGEWSFQVRAE